MFGHQLLRQPWIDARPVRHPCQPAHLIRQGTALAADFNAIPRAGRTELTDKLGQASTESHASGKPLVLALQ